MVGARHSNDGGLSFRTGSACARGEDLLFICWNYFGPRRSIGYLIPVAWDIGILYVQ